MEMSASIKGIACVMELFDFLLKVMTKEQKYIVWQKSYNKSQNVEERSFCSRWHDKFLPL